MAYLVDIPGNHKFPFQKLYQKSEAIAEFVFNYLVLCKGQVDYSKEGIQ